MCGHCFKNEFSMCVTFSAKNEKQRHMLSMKSHIWPQEHTDRLSLLSDKFWATSDPLDSYQMLYINKTHLTVAHLWDNLKEQILDFLTVEAHGVCIKSKLSCVLKHICHRKTMSLQAINQQCKMCRRSSAKGGQRKLHCVHKSTRIACDGKEQRKQVLTTSNPPYEHKRMRVKANNPQRSSSMGPLKKEILWFA